MLIKFEVPYGPTDTVYINIQAIQYTERGSEPSTTLIHLVKHSILVRGGFDEVADKINTVVSW